MSSGIAGMGSTSAGIGSTAERTRQEKDRNFMDNQRTVKKTEFIPYFPTCTSDDNMKVRIVVISTIAGGIIGSPFSPVGFVIGAGVGFAVGVAITCKC